MENLDRLQIPGVGVLGINNADLIDRTFGKSSNSYLDVIDSNHPYKDQVPFSADPIAFRLVVAADLVNYDPTLIIGADLIAVIKHDITNNFRVQLNSKMAQNGVFVTQRFTTNTVSGPYTLIKKSFSADGVIGSLLDQWTREVIVTPTGGANSVSEYVLINMVSSIFLQYNAANDEYTTGSTKRQAYFCVEKFLNTRQASSDINGWTDSTVIILKGQGLITQQTSLNPIYCHQDSDETIAGIIAAAAGINLK